MFIGRDFELKILNDLYEEDRFQFIPITGRRRVGKTRLIQEFIRDKPAIFFRAVPGNVAQTETLNTKQATVQFRNTTTATLRAKKLLQTLLQQFLPGQVLLQNAENLTAHQSLLILQNALNALHFRLLKKAI